MGSYKAIKTEHSYQLDLSARGYVVLFRPDQVNNCPGCGHSQWFVDRVSAECGICGPALPIADAQQSPARVGKKAVALHIVSDEAEQPDSGTNRRRDERVSGENRILGLHIDGSPHPFKLENISSGGVMGAMVPGIGQARSLAIELEDGTMVPAELKWSDGEFAGLAFISPPEK